MMEENSQNKFKRICVFCGSSSGNRTVFSDAALDLGHELVKRKIDLVYGGGSVGLMGLISKTVHDGGCHVLGVIPTALMPLEISGETVGELKSVSDMHGRKAEMARQADAFIALPGGYGTMEEMLEMITWSQLGIHSKPVGLLNVDGYYNSLLALFDNGVAEGFIKPADRHIVLSATTAEELIVKMEGPPLGDFREEIGKVKIHVIGISTFRTTKHCALSVEVDFTEQYVPLHEQVAPLTSWESGRRGYSTQPNTP